MVELDSLDWEVRQLAFWLQDKIFREGIPGIGFMENGRVWAEENADDEVADGISKHLKKL